MARMTLAEIVAQGYGRGIYGDLFAAKGLGRINPSGDIQPQNVWAAYEDGNNEAGNRLISGRPTDAALSAYDGYTFDWARGDRDSGTLTAYDSAGNPAGSYYQPERESALSSLAEWGALAAAGFGGVGLLGLGPLGGALGGLGGAGVVDAGVGASVGGVGGEVGAGLAAGGSGVITGGAGLTAPGLAGGAGLGAGLGVAGGAGAAGAAGAAGSAGFWGAALKVAAPVLGSVAGGLIQSNAAGKAANAQTAAARAGIEAIQKALAPYQQAGAAGVAGQQDLLGLNGAEKQQAAIAALQASPAFTSQQQLGENRILANASATGGLRGGNVQGALAQFSPALLSSLIDQQYTRLGGLAATGANAAAGVGTATANLQGQIGSAQAGQALANGSAFTNVLGSGLGALGQYLGQQQAAPGIAPAISTNTPFGQFQLGGGF